MSQALETSILSNLTSSGLPKLEHAEFRRIVYIFPNRGRALLTSGEATVGISGDRERKVVVLKTISKNYLANIDEKRKEKLIQYFEREAGIWRYIESHPNILKLYGYMEVPGQMLPSLVSPFYPAGDVRGYVEYPDNKHISAQQRIRLTRDIACGLEFLHSLSPVIVHRDVRGTNVLVNDVGDITAVLIDFGSAKLSDPRLFPVFNSTQISNDAWSPPEYILKPDEYPSPTTYGDIWSLACTCYEIFTARDPYPRKVDIVDAHSHGQIPIRPPKELVDISDALWAFLERCWSPVPDMRPSARNSVLELDMLSSIS